MNIPFAIVLFVTVLSTVLANAAPKLRDSEEYLRVHWRSSATELNGDIWIYPDDSFRVRVYNPSKPDDVREDRKGAKKGLYKKIVKLADSTAAWKLTNERIESDIEKARKALGAVHRVDDARRVYLIFQLKDRSLRADLRGPEELAGFYKNAKLVQTFAKIQRAVLDETGRR